MASPCDSSHVKYDQCSNILVSINDQTDKDTQSRFCIAVHRTGSSDFNSTAEHDTKSGDVESSTD
jgi:hypothetical protein